MTPNTGTAPSLTGFPAASVTFDDPDASWFNVWNIQPGRDTTFTVTHSAVANSTTVALGAFSVALDPVPLLASQSRNAAGTVTPQGRQTLTLQIAATLTDAMNNVLAMNGGSCSFTGIVIE